MTTHHTFIIVVDLFSAHVIGYLASPVVKKKVLHNETEDNQKFCVLLAPLLSMWPHNGYIIPEETLVVRAEEKLLITVSKQHQDRLSHICPNS